MTKPITPELIERILEQQEKNHREYIDSLKTLLNPAPKPSFIQGAIIDLKERFYGWLKKFKKTDNEPQFLNFRIACSACFGWDWNEDPIICLKQLGENPDDYDFWVLYNKMAESYAMRHNNNNHNQ